MEATVNLLWAVESLAASPMGPVALLPLVVAFAYLLLLITRMLFAVIPVLFSAPVRLMLAGFSLAAMVARMLANVVVFRAFIGRYRSWTHG